MGQAVACNGASAFTEYALATAALCTPVQRAGPQEVACVLSGVTACVALEVGGWLCGVRTVGGGRMHGAGGGRWAEWVATVSLTVPSPLSTRGPASSAPVALRSQHPWPCVLSTRGPAFSAPVTLRPQYPP